MIKKKEDNKDWDKIVLVSAVSVSLAAITMLFLQATLNGAGESESANQIARYATLTFALAAVLYSILIFRTKIVMRKISFVFFAVLMLGLAVLSDFSRWLTN